MANVTERQCDQTTSSTRREMRIYFVLFVLAVTALFWGLLDFASLARGASVKATTTLTRQEAMMTQLKSIDSKLDVLMFAHKAP